MREVVETVGFARKIEDCREAGFRLANRRLLSDLLILVGSTGFEPATFRSRTESQFAELLQKCDDFTLSITPA